MQCNMQYTIWRYVWMCAICNVDNDYSPPIVEARAMRRSQGWGQLRKFSRLSLIFKYIFVFLLFCLFCSVLLSSDIFNCRLPCSQAGASFNSMNSHQNDKHIKHQQYMSTIYQYINSQHISTHTSNKYYTNCKASPPPPAHPPPRRPGWELWHWDMSKIENKSKTKQNKSVWTMHKNPCMIKTCEAWQCSSGVETFLCSRSFLSTAPLHKIAVDSLLTCCL